MDSSLLNSRRIFAFGGLVGSGKTTNGQLLAERIGALHLDADVVRKELWGVSPTERLPEEAYRRDARITTQEVIAEMFKRARVALQQDRDVVLCMTFAARWHVESLETLAHETNAILIGIWCKTADVDLQRSRVENRVGDVSDAGIQVLESMLKTHPNTPPDGWLLLDTTADRATVASQLYAQLRL